MITLNVGGIIALILLIIIGVLLYIIYELLRTYKFKQRLLAEMEALENKRLNAYLTHPTHLFTHRRARGGTEEAKSLA